jgi:hypothetical protein
VISKESRPTRNLKFAVLFVAALALIGGSISAWAIDGITYKFADREAEAVVQKNNVRAREAFLSIIPVLKHPRCLNCHSTGDYPRQGDDGHTHAMNVRRGSDGHGKYGQKCSTCHQEYNVAGLNMPPGAPNWHLPPPDMPMIWEGRTPGQICRQIKDPKQNGGKTIAQIVEHMTSDKLVLWGWEPGEGRTLPPMGHDEFSRKVVEWSRYGAACPE